MGSSVHIKEKFERIGARIRFRAASEIPQRQRPDRFSIDVARDRKGEIFEMLTNAGGA